MHTQNRKESAMDITGVGNLSYLYNYGISDSDTRHVTGKENGIGSVDENGKQKECQTCKNRKYVDGSDVALYAPVKVENCINGRNMLP